MTLKYDMHLSAYEMSKQAILLFENFGFARDEFANNTRCETTTYHGTYGGQTPLPSDSLWFELCKILENDESFVGGLEEESYDTDEVKYLTGQGTETQRLLPRMQTIQPQPNVFKACDVHINLDLDNCILERVKLLDCLQVASFDKPHHGQIHRVFTVTCERYEDGVVALGILNEQLKNIHGLVGKIKLERTTRFYRKPSNAYVLPLTTKIAFQDWVSELELTFA